MSHFFSITFLISKKLEWCIAKLTTQLQHQLLADGTSYEGSTSYHCLVAEILLHFITLIQKLKYDISPVLIQKISAMLLFAADCSNQSGKLIKIGDDDGGKLLTGIVPHQILQKSILEMSRIKEQKFATLTTYPSFGVSIIRNKKWHITFRHPSFSSHQPTGHFHQDLLAFTMSIHGQEVFIDPGSGIYTAHQKLRNNLRSWQSHNTFYPEVAEKITSLEAFDLLQLPRIPAGHTKRIIQNKKSCISIEESHGEFSQLGIIAYRKIIFNPHQEQLVLEDWYQKTGTRTKDNIKSCWYLHLHPNLQVHKKHDGWLITHDKTPLVMVKSTLLLTLTQGWYAPTYGILQPTKTLFSHTNISYNQKASITITCLKP